MSLSGVVGAGIVTVMILVVIMLTCSVKVDRTMYQVRSQGVVLAEGATSEEAIAKLYAQEDRVAKMELWLKGTHVAELEWIPTLAGPRITTHWNGD